MAAVICAAFGVTPQQMVESVDDDQARGALNAVLGLEVRRGVPISYIVKRFGVEHDTIREAFGFVRQVFFEHTLTSHSDTRKVAEKLNIAWSIRDKRVRLTDIQAAMCKVTGVCRSDMLSLRRTAPIVLPRQAAMALCKAITNRSLPEIGRAFDGRDHTTILHACRKLEPAIEAIRKTDLNRSTLSIATEFWGMVTGGMIGSYRKHKPK